MTITLNIWSFVFLITAIHGLGLSIVLIGSGRKRAYKPNWYAASLVISYVALIMIYLIYWNSLNLDLRYIHFNQTYWPIVFLQAPLFYLYLKRQLSTENVKMLSHFILPVIVVILLSRFLLLTASDKAEFFSSGNHRSSYWSWVNYFLIAASIFQLCLYLLLSLKTIKEIGPSNFLSFSERRTKAWAITLVKCFAGYILLYILYYVLVVAMGFPVEWDYMISLGMAVLVYIIGYKAYAQPELFAEREKIQYAQKIDSAPLVSTSEAHQYKKELESIMSTEQPYLNDRLKLSHLANRLGISEHQLSYILNSHLKSSFADFVNSYRIMAAKDLLTDPDKSHLKILAIGYDSGFYSKATFYSTFKKHTGTTPTEFRNSTVSRK